MSSWLCPACLASNAETYEQCVSCRAPLQLGERFAIVESLVSRGSARTLGGIEHDGGRPVIVKMLSVSGLSDWKQLELFERGIGVLRGLSHPGVPQHLGDGQIERGGETIYYWVQERVPGRTLAAGLREGQRWTEAQARALAEEVLEILEYLQGFSPPIVHRDLKPSNVIERPDGGFTIIDFDLVKDTLDPEGGETTALGTAGYAPLEQLMGRAVPASDLYGLGATLVAVLSRKSPADLLDDEGRRLEFRGHVRVSEAFAGWIERLLDPRVGQRPVDAAAARALLRQADEMVGPNEDETESGNDPKLQPAGPGPTPAPTEEPSQAIATVGPSNQPVVVMQAPLAQLHPAPRWLMLVRLAVLGGSIVAVPASGWVLAPLVVAIWIASGLLVRYPVRLPPGRAMFLGGLSNTDQPGRYWLRRRWVDKPCSISLQPLYLDWRPAPTRVDHGEHYRWLELELELWVQPRTDDVGQFTALLQYQTWTAHPRIAATKLRDELLGAVVGQLEPAGLLEGAPSAVVRVDGVLEAALDEGLSRIGLSRVRVGRQRAELRARTDDLSGEDRLWIDARALPNESNEPPG